MVQSDRPHMTIQCDAKKMRFTFRLIKARTDTHTHTHTLIIVNVYFFKTD